MKQKCSFTTLGILTMSLIFQNPSLAAECKSQGQKNCSVTIRDSRGVKVGSEERGNNGVTTIRDNRGIKQGTITPKIGNSGCEIIRDSRGVKVGTRGNC